MNLGDLTIDWSLECLCNNFLVLPLRLNRSEISLLDVIFKFEFPRNLVPFRGPDGGSDGGIDGGPE
jgi:hypothetical protein